jgi:hypothetical protein
MDRNTMKKCFLSTPHPSCMMRWWVLVLLLWSDETQERKMKAICWNCPTLGLSSSLHSWLFDHMFGVWTPHDFWSDKLLQCWNNFKGGSLKLYCSYTSNSSNLFGLCALCTESTKSVHYIPFRNQHRSPNLEASKF